MEAPAIILALRELSEFRGLAQRIDENGKCSVQLVIPEVTAEIIMS